VIAVRADNPAPAINLADLARPGLRVALCAPQQPCGAAAATMLSAAQVSLSAPIEEPDVRAALAHLADGTADAALVYRFTAEAAGNTVLTVEVPQAAAHPADLVAVVPGSARNAGIAHSFLDYLASPQVRDALVARGFTPPA
jgi:molybdate transport system substrate-binding protein